MSVSLFLSCVCVQSLSYVQLFATLWTVPSRLLCPWDFSGKNTGVGSHFLLQGIFPTQIKPMSLVSPTLAGGSLPLAPHWNLNGNWE